MARKMKLQINTAGSWKDVVKFDAKDHVAVLAATGLLARVLGAGTRWCIVDDFGERHWLDFSDDPNDVITDSSIVLQFVAVRRESAAKGADHG